MQENLAGELWLDLSSRIFKQTLGQPYEYHLTGNISALASDLLSNLECLLRDILTPALRAISCLISIIFLVAGILYVGGSSAFVLILSMFILYILIGYLINPALRKASRQKIVTRERYTKGFFESFQAIVDLKLGLSEPHSFQEDLIDLHRYLRDQLLMPQFFPKYRGYLLSPLVSQ